MRVFKTLKGAISNWATPAQPTPIIKFFSMNDVKEFLGSEKELKIPLIREGCEIMKIPFVGGGTVFFPSQPTLEQEFEKLKDDLNHQLTPKLEYIVAYEKLERPNTYLSYYRIIAIKSNDMLDLKKAFKIQKLKAFL